MSQIVRDALRNLPKFIEYRQIRVNNMPSYDVMLKDMSTPERQYIRVEGVERGKSIHIIIVGARSPTIESSVNFGKLIARAGKSNICLFYERALELRSISNYKDGKKFEGQQINFYPIGILSVVHPELPIAPRYYLADEKKILEDMKIKKSELRSFIYTDDPPAVWYNWPVGSLIGIESAAHVTGIRVRYRWVKKRD